MTNISRRKFLKGAGAAALAVAAAGVLAGCSNNEVIDAVATEKIGIIFEDTDGSKILEGKSINLKKGDKVGTKDLADKLPNGYMIAEENDNLAIDWDAKTVTVKVCEAQDVVFKLLDSDTGAQVGEDIKAVVPKSKTTFEIAELSQYVEVPEGYELVQSPRKPSIANGVVKVAVSKKI